MKKGKCNTEKELEYIVENERNSMSIKNQAAKGVMWNTIERFSTQGMQFVLTIVIARILSPDDYGLVAMLGIFMAVAQTFVDSGFGNALIQKKNRTEVDYSTTFYFNIVISVFIYLLFFVSAPWISQFYNQPKLTLIARVYGILIILNSLASIQMTRLTIALDFRKIAFASLLSVSVGGSIGIWMAYQGYGVWALVWQALFGSLAWGGGLWILARWMPKFCFSWTSFRTLFSFGSKILFSSLLHTLYTNMYSLVVGKFFNASTLGYFNRAYTLGLFPAQNFANIIQKVTYPIQCRYQDDDERFNQIFVSYLRIAGFVLFPLMAGLAVLAEPVITLLLTEKWLPIVPLLQIICMSMMWLPMMQANVSVLDAKGRSDYHLRSEIIKKILAVFILLSALPFGIEGVCLGMLVYSVTDLIVVIAYSRKLTSIGYRRQLKIFIPSLLLALAMGGIVWLATWYIASPAGKLIIGGVSGVLFYGILAYLFKFQELKMITSFFKKGEKFYHISA